MSCYRAKKWLLTGIGLWYQMNGYYIPDFENVDDDPASKATI
jgi:hypothetical protein